MSLSLANVCVSSATAEAVASIANERLSREVGFPTTRYAASDVLPVLNGLLDRLTWSIVPDLDALGRAALRDGATVAATVQALPSALEAGSAPEFATHAALFGVHAPGDSSRGSKPSDDSRGETQGAEHTDQPAQAAGQGEPTNTGQVPGSAGQSSGTDIRIAVGATIGMVVIVIAAIVYRVVRS